MNKRLQHVEFDCDDVLERLTDMSRASSAGEEAAIAAHVSECKECRAWVVAVGPGIRWMRDGAHAVTAQGTSPVHLARPKFAFHAAAARWACAAAVAGLLVAAARQGLWRGSDPRVHTAGVRDATQAAPEFVSRSPVVAADPRLVRGLRDTWRWTTVSAGIRHAPQSHGSGTDCCIDCHNVTSSADTHFVWEQFRQSCHRCHPVAGSVDRDVRVRRA